MYLSLRGLRTPAVCARIAASFADARAEAMVADAAATGTGGGGGGGGGGVNAAAVVGAGYAGESAHTPETRRVCAVLGVAPALFAHVVMKRLVALGAGGLAMDVARALSADDACPHAVRDDANGSGSGIGGNGGGGAGAADAATLLDAAVTLCTLASKPAPPAARGRPAPTVARLFEASRALLRAAATTCPPELLARSLDILRWARRCMRTPS